MAQKRDLPIPVQHRARVMYEVMVDFGREFGFSPTVFDIDAIVEALDEGDMIEQTFGGSLSDELQGYDRFYLAVLPFKGPYRRQAHPVVIYGLPKVRDGEVSKWVKMQRMTTWITVKAREILGTELEYWVPGNFPMGGRQVSGKELTAIRRAEQERAPSKTTAPGKKAVVAA